MRKLLWAGFALLMHAGVMGQNFVEVSGFKATGVRWSGCGWGDKDNDGDLDVVVIGGDINNNTPTAELWENKGGNVFVRDSVTVMEPLWYSENAVAWGDYNGDGFKDFVIAGYYENNTTKTFLYKNIGGKYFEKDTATLIGVRQGVLSWVDFDNDGDLDLFINGNNYGPYVEDLYGAQMYVNDGRGVFTRKKMLGVPMLQEMDAAWADFNGDGYQDFIMAGYQERTAMYYNQKDGTFKEVNIKPSGLPQLRDGRFAVADYDKDGDIDFMIGGYGWTGTKNGDFDALYRNDGDTVFTKQPIVFTESGRGDFKFADFNNDTYPDLAMIGEHAWSENHTEVWMNDTKGGFTKLAGQTFTGASIGDVSVGDYDNDGDMDFLVVGTSFTLDAPISKIYENTFINTNTVDKKMLLATLDTAINKKDEAFKKLFTNLTNSIAMADSVYKNDTVTQADVNKATSQLSKAIAAFMIIAKDSIVYNIVYKDSTKYNVVVKDTVVKNPVYKDSVVYNKVYKDSLVINYITRDSIRYVVRDSVVKDSITVLVLDTYTRTVDLKGGRSTIKTYPNPVTNTVTIESNFVIKSVQIVDIAGITVSTTEVGDKKANISVNHLDEGVYFLLLVMNEGIVTQKIEVRR